jgi:flagellar basal-body rod protein FlgC
MIPGLNSALSGLNAASKRLETSANNVANQFSTTSLVDGVTVNKPYQPQRVVQTSLSGGGVMARTQSVEPGTVQVNDPDNVAADAQGITQYPNVNLEDEVINQITAKYDFKANLHTIKAGDSMIKNLLDIIS